jgi:hypothetical protein
MIHCFELTMPQVLSIATDNQELPASGYNDQHIKYYKHWLGLSGQLLSAHKQTETKNCWHRRGLRIQRVPYPRAGSSHPQCCGLALVYGEPLGCRRHCHGRHDYNYLKLFPSASPFQFHRNHLHSWYAVFQKECCGMDQVDKPVEIGWWLKRSMPQHLTGG